MNLIWDFITLFKCLSILSSITKSSSMHLALGGTMPDPSIPPSAAKHMGGSGGIQDSPLKGEQTGKGESQGKSSWRLLRFLEVFFTSPVVVFG